MRHVILETIRQGTNTSATVIRTGNDEANKDAVIAAIKNIVRTHLRAFSATIHDFHVAIISTKSNGEYNNNDQKNDKHSPV